MKRLPFLLLLLVVSATLQAQKERPRYLPAFDHKLIHFGFTVGFNMMDVGLARNYDAENFIYADLSHPLPGFQVSIVSDLRLGDNWNLRFLPGISFGSRELDYYEYDEVAQQMGERVQLKDADNPVAIGPSFLDFPLLFKYRSERVNNYRPYLIGGINFRYDMSAKRQFDVESNEYVKFKPADFYLEFGFGVDTYLRFFKFAPELKVAVGLTNILTDDYREPYPQFVSSIDRATSYIVMLNFHFE